MARTRIIVATTHIDRQFTQISKEALEDAADQVNRGSRPLLTVEHDPTLPPFGKGVKASVEPCDDGHHQLVVEHEVFDEVLWTDLTDGSKLFRQESATDTLPFSDRYSELPDDPFISFDPVNFGSQSDYVAFIDDIKRGSNVEFSISSFGRKSLIPDPELLVGITKTSAGYLLAKKILEKTADKVLDLAADDLAKFYAFIRAIVTSAVRYMTPKGRPITYIFVLRTDPRIEFIARSADSNLVMSALTLERLESALSQASFYRSILGAVRIQYLLNTNGEWEFNYLLTGTGAVIGTEKSLSRREKAFELLAQDTSANPTTAEESLALSASATEDSPGKTR